MVETMKTFLDFHRQFRPQNEFSVRQKKNIVIEDSVKSFNFVPFEKNSKVLTGRNPFRKDEEIIDYEMDSEEEWAEENGEDVEDCKDDEDEDMQ